VSVAAAEVQTQAVAYTYMQVSGVPDKVANNLGKRLGEGSEHAPQRLGAGGGADQRAPAGPL